MRREPARASCDLGVPEAMVLWFLFAVLMFALCHCGDPRTLPVEILDGGCYLDCHVAVPGGVLNCRCDTPDYLFSLDRCVGSDDPATGNQDCGSVPSECVVCG